MLEDEHVFQARFSMIGALGLAVFLTGCVDIYGGGGRGPVMYPGQVKSAPVWGVESGSLYAAGFTSEDRRRIADAAGVVLRPGGPSVAQWGPTGSGRSGGVTAGAPFLIGLDSIAGARISAPAEIETNVPLGPASGTYRAAKNVNVRAGTNTGSKILRTLKAGALVKAFGSAQPEDWLLVGLSDRVYGYAFAPLLEAEGDADPILAGGTPRAPKLCRDLNLSLSMAGGQRDSWTMVVCKRPDGTWQVASERGLS